MRNRLGRFHLLYTTIGDHIRKIDSEYEAEVVCWDSGVGSGGEFGV